MSAPADYLDFNGDGKPDIVLSSTNGKYVTVLQGNGWRFTAQPQAAYTGGLAVVSTQAAE